MPRACFKRDPPEEPPSEERYAVEGRSPGLRVIAMAPAFPSLVQKLSDTKWSHHSPLTVAGAAPDSARRAPPASRLSPAVMPEAGNLDRLLQQHREAAVKQHIKISLYASAERRPERSISGWNGAPFNSKGPDLSLEAVAISRSGLGHSVGFPPASQHCVIGKNALGRQNRVGGDGVRSVQPFEMN